MGLEQQLFKQPWMDWQHVPHTWYVQQPQNTISVGLTHLMR